MILLLNCRQVTRLVLLAQDRGLPWHQRVLIHLHLMMCDPCPRFVRQIALMRKASARWRNYSEES